MTDFNTLLNRLYTQLENHGKSTADPEKPRLIVPPVKLGKETMRGIKFIWTNFNDVCRALNRDSRHVQNFIDTELGSNVPSSFNQEGYLIITSRSKKYNSKTFESLIIKYAEQYIRCKSCKFYDSKLDGNLIICNRCHAEHSLDNF